MSIRATHAGGLAGIVAGAGFVVTAIIDTAAPVDTSYDTPSEIGYVAASTVAFAAPVVAVIGIRAHLARFGPVPRLATVAIWLVGIGYGVVALLTAGNLLAGLRILVTVRLAFAGVVLIGSAILGVVVLRASRLPWWCGVLLIVAFPLGHFANALFRSTENILLALLWGSVGFALLRHPDGAVDPGAGRPAPDLVR